MAGTTSIGTPSRERWLTLPPDRVAQIEASYGLKEPALDALANRRPQVGGRCDPARQRRGVREELLHLLRALAASLARGEVRLHLCGLRLAEAAVHEVVETIVELVARHDASASLSSRRARKSWAFDVPGARFSSAAISS